VKILRVVSDLYPAVVGGIGIHSHMMSLLQVQCGHEITVLTLQQKKILATEELIGGYKVLRFPVYFSICGNSFAPGLILEILKKKKSFDIIHAHSHLFFSTNVCIFARLTGSAPLIITNHGLISASTPGWLNFLYKHVVSKLSFHIADRIICYTNIEKETLVDLGINPEKISVIHNGVDTEIFTQKQYKREQEKQQILWVGRFVSGKGVEYLIDAFSLVRQKMPNTNLVLVGEGPGRTTIQEQIKNRALQASVTLINHLDNTKLPEVYKKSDVFVLPSLMEGVPRTILEAMSCGIPVITTNLPHLRHLVDRAGLVIPPKDPSSLSKAILMILEDSQLAEKMGQYGHKKIEDEYSWEDTVEKTLAEYYKLIHS
jgi:glycosyltransferase involved in cell wall biosynthesis